jgi:hypothetical protein
MSRRASSGRRQRRSPCRPTTNAPKLGEPYVHVKDVAEIVPVAVGGAAPRLSVTGWTTPTNADHPALGIPPSRYSLTRTGHRT